MNNNGTIGKVLEVGIRLFMVFNYNTICVKKNALNFRAFFYLFNISLYNSMFSIFIHFRRLNISVFLHFFPWFYPQYNGTFLYRRQELHTKGRSLEIVNCFFVILHIIPSFSFKSLRTICFFLLNASINVLCSSYWYVERISAQWFHFR
jgi:hypothetical protein